MIQDEQIEKYAIRTIIILVFCWSFIVLPCCWFGYGSDEDAWAVGEASSIIWSTGEYTVSRTTGFPLHELLMALCTHWGTWYAANFFSYLSGLTIALFLILLIKENHFKNSIWVLAGILFLPSIIINASSTLDYVPSLAMFLGAYYFFVRKKYYLASILIGISCGFRPSNGAFIVPMILAQFNEDKNYKLATSMFLTAFLTGILAYSPVLIRYGIIDPGRPVEIPFLKNIMIAGYQALTLFGIWQSMLIGIIFLFYFPQLKTAFKNSLYVRFHIQNILMWVLFFIFISNAEGEYLFPIIFSIIFIADTLFEKRHFKILIVSLLSYNFFSLEMLGGESGDRKIIPRIEWGYTIRDLEDRRWKMWYREATTKFKCKNKTLLMYGVAYVKANNKEWEYSKISNDIIKQKNGNLYLSERILNEALLKKLQKEGFEMYVWNNRKWEYIILRMDFWIKYVKVIYDLEDFLGSKEYGKLMQ